jgi:hypothetical protein
MERSLSVFPEDFFMVDPVLQSGTGETGDTVGETGETAKRTMTELFAIFESNIVQADLHFELQTMTIDMLRAVYLACQAIPESAIDLSRNKDQVLRDAAVEFARRWWPQVLSVTLAELVLLTLAKRAFCPSAAF